jgi:signal-transduction protein with cAMP-binding, CBS, and nucleotidyltransferase domain
MGDSLPIKYLEKSIVFDSLNMEQKETICSRVSIRSFDEGEEILQLHQCINAIYIIGDGSAKAMDEENIERQILSDGEEIGLECLVDEPAFPEYTYVSNGCTAMGK